MNAGLIGMLGAVGDTGATGTAPLSISSASLSSMAMATIAAEQAAVRGPTSLLRESWGGIALIALGVVFLIAAAASARTKAAPWLLTIGVLLGAGGGAWIIVNDVRRTKAAASLDDAWQQQQSKLWAQALERASMNRAAQQQRQSTAGYRVVEASSTLHQSAQLPAVGESTKSSQPLAAPTVLAQTQQETDAAGQNHAVSTPPRGDGPRTFQQPTSSPSAPPALAKRGKKKRSHRRRLSWRDDAARAAALSSSSHRPSSPLLDVREFNKEEEPSRVRTAPTHFTGDQPPRPLQRRQPATSSPISSYGWAGQQPLPPWAGAPAVEYRPVVNFIPYTPSSQPGAPLADIAREAVAESLYAPPGSAASPCGPIYYSPPSAYPDVNDMADERQRFWSRPETPTLDHHRRVQGLREAALSLGPSRDGRSILVVPDA